MWLRGILPSILSNIPEEYLRANNTTHTCVSYITPLQIVVYLQGHTMVMQAEVPFPHTPSSHDAG